MGGLPARSRDVGESLFSTGRIQGEEVQPSPQARVSHPGRVLGLGFGIGLIIANF